MRSCLLWLFPLAPWTVSSQGAAPRSPAMRPNIVFILVDDLRWDELGIAGHPFLKTPNIDRIGHEGARFRNAFMTTPLSSPSRDGFLAGQYAHPNGITEDVDRSVLSHKLVTFPRLLCDSGYDLKADPYEIKNLINQPGGAKPLAAMKKELVRLLVETGNR